MFDLIFPTFNFNLQYAQKLMADIPDEQLCAQPVPGRVMNHPAWTIGHLTWANANGSSLLTGTAPPLVAEYQRMFGTGTAPHPDRATYPAKELLINAFTDAHKSLLQAIQSATPEQLAKPAPDRMRARFATLAPMMVGLMTSHYTNHIGQLSAWRRAMGFAGVF